MPHRLTEDNLEIMKLFIAFVFASILGAFGKMADYYEAHTQIFEMIKYGFQLFAYGGSGTVGLVAMIKFLIAYFKKK